MKFLTAALVVAAALGPTMATSVSVCPAPTVPQNGRIRGELLGSYYIGSLVYYTCNKGYVLDDKYSWNICKLGLLAPYWLNAVPTCKPTRCPALTAPEGGSVEVGSFQYNGVATYKCFSDFNLVGDSTLRCQANLQWSGTAPTCVRVNCGGLPSPMDGSVAISSTNVGGVAMYNCNQGFNIAGPRTRECQANGQWSGIAPECIAVQCEVLTAPAGGSVMVASSGFGGTANYQCNFGLRLIGVSDRKCQANGQWSDGAPTCEAIDCGNLPAPTDGSILAAITKVGGVAIYRCNDGFRLAGNNVRSCQPNGQWSGAAPRCEPVDCDTLPAPDDGTVAITSTKFEGIANYQCNRGFQLIGKSVRECQANEQWSESAPICQIIDCGSLQAPADGSIVVTSTKFGNVATYRCNDGFIVVGVSSRTCQDDGQWSAKSPRCDAVDCGTIPAPTDGSVSISSTKFRGTANYRCNDGFELVGKKLRQCQANGQWSDSAPTCERLDCGYLQAPVDGSVDMTSTELGGVATYRCNTGFNLVGIPSRSCQNNGKWSGAPPRCASVDCDALTAPGDGSVVVSSRKFLGSANYHCNAGFELVGKSVRQCQADGQWSGSAPTCQAINCGTLQAPSEGSVEVTTTRLGGVATYKCRSGFVIAGISRRACEANGRWSGSAPRCDAVDCGKLEAPAAGSITITSHTFGGVATYQCQKGYTLVGSGTRRCEDNGKWSGKAPSCIVVDCEYPNAPYGGSVFVRSLTIGSVAYYSCDDGLSLVGYTSRTCQADGRWSGSVPTCDSTTIAY